MEFIGYFSSIVWPIMAISQLIEMASRGKASLNRIGELLDAEINVKDRDARSQIFHLGRGLRRRQLYPHGGTHG